MDSMDFLKKNDEYKQETPEMTAERLGFSEFNADEIRRSYEIAGIHENEFRKFDAATGMMKDATRTKDVSEEDFTLGKARTMAMNNMKMAHHSMLDLKSDVVNAGHMSKEMRNICKSIDKITEQIGMTVNCTCTANGKTMFDLGKYREYIGNVVGSYDYAIEKAMYYLEKKSPRTEKGKIRYKFVENFLAYMRRERDAFSANAQIKERQMNAKLAANVKGENILFDIRAEMIGELKNEKGGITKSSQSYTRNKKKYFFKEDREVELGEISYLESAKVCLYDLCQIPDHVKTEIDMLKTKAASLVLELHGLFETDSQFLDALLLDLANEKIDCEMFADSIHDRIAAWGLPEERASEISSAIREELENEHADTSEYKGALQQVLNYNEAGALARFNGISAGRRLGARNVASRRVAEQLGCKDCIADSKTVIFTDEKGAIKCGNSMEEVKGSSLATLIRKYHRIEFTGKAKRMICEMQFMDFICGQMDRHAGNYIVNGKLKNGVIIIDSIVGIDNDMSFGLLSYKDLKLGFNRLAGTESGGKYAMRKISRDLFMKIMRTKPEMLKFSLADLGLSEKEFDALADRLKGMQSYLRRAYKKFGDELLVDKDEDWDDLSSDDIYDGEKTFTSADGSEQYQSIWGGIEANLQNYGGQSKTI